MKPKQSAICCLLVASLLLTAFSAGAQQPLPRVFTVTCSGR